MRENNPDALVSSVQDRAMQPWRTISQERAYSCDGFDIINETVELPDGNEAEFDYLTETESVVILPFTPDGDVVTIREWRHAVRRMNLGLPAGSLEAGEKPREAVGRELLEETGYKPAEVAHLTTVEPSNGFSDAIFHYFVAWDCKPAGDQRLDSDETIEPVLSSFEELSESVRTGEFRDGRSAFAIAQYLLQYPDGRQD